MKLPRRSSLGHQGDLALDAKFLPHFPNGSTATRPASPAEWPKGRGQFAVSLNRGSGGRVSRSSFLARQEKKKNGAGYKDTPGINEVPRSRIIRDDEVKHILDRQGCNKRPR